MKYNCWEKFRILVAEEESSIARSKSLLPFHPSQLQAQRISPLGTQNTSREVESEIQRESANLVDRLWDARTDVPIEQLSALGLQVGRFLLDVARSMDDLSVNRLLVVGNAYRANRMFETS
jgi:hypothetical protein